MNAGPDPSYALRADAEGFYEGVEWLLVVLVIGVLMAYAMDSYRLVFTKLRMIEPSFLSTGDRISVHEHFALHGSWPAAADASLLKDADPERPLGAFTSDVVLSDFGRLDYTFDGTRGMPNGVLSFRPYQANDASSAILWHCGSADVPHEFLAGAADGTTLDEAYLPAFCRGIRDR